MLTKGKNAEIIALAEEILRNIELSEIPLSSVVLKCARLARLTEDEGAQKIFKYELVGYPKEKKGEFVLYEAFELARKANRIFFSPDPNLPKGSQHREVMFSQTLGELEATLESAKEQIRVAVDGNVSVSSANPNQFLMTPSGNAYERSTLRSTITSTSRKINQLRAGYYEYVLGVYHSHKFGNVVEQIFDGRKSRVDNWLAGNLPETSKKFISVYENLLSENQEDWANAVHTCRRALKDMADLLCPADNREISIEGGGVIKLTEENYIVRLKEFVKGKVGSGSFSRIVGSHINLVGDRIDSIYKATTKGSHDVVSRQEAERYVIYTYLLISDLSELTTIHEEN